METATHNGTNGIGHATAHDEGAEGTEQRQLPDEGRYIVKARSARFVRFAQKNSVGMEVIFPIPMTVPATANKAAHEVLVAVPLLLHWTEKARDRSMQSLRYLGWTGTDPLELVKQKVALPNEVEAEVEHEVSEYTTKTGEKKTETRARVKWINRIGSNLQSASEADLMGAFRTMFMSVAATVDETGAKKGGAVPTGTTKKPEPSLDDDAAPPAAGVNTDDEIPF